jgi:hypothetical protein
MSQDLCTQLLIKKKILLQHTYVDCVILREQVGIEMPQSETTMESSLLSHEVGIRVFNTKTMQQVGPCNLIIYNS